MFESVDSKSKRMGAGRVFTPPPPPQRSNAHQTLEQANAQTHKADDAADQQQGVRDDNLSHFTNPGDSGGEHGTDVGEQSSQSVSSFSL